MSDLRRRDVLTGAAAASAAALWSPAATAGREARVERALTRLARQRDRLSEKMRPGQMVLDALLPADEPLRRSAVPALGATLTYAELRGLTPEEQAHPAVQDALWSAADATAAGVRASADWLEGLDEETWADLDAALSRGPFDLDAALQATFDEVASMGLPARTRDELHGSARALKWSIRRRGLRAAITEQLGRFRRMQGRLAEHADPLDALRIAGAADGLPDDETLAAAQAGWATAGRSTAAPTGPPDEEGVTPARSASDLDRTLGALLIGMGIAGGVAIVVSTGVTGGFVLLCACVSIPLLLGTILCIVAGGKLLAGE